MKNNKCEISIGLPIYNGEKFLKEAIDSILNQTFEDFELIISDNASTDNTEAICREYAAKDSRIRYYRNQQNLGAAKNYNNVFELSKSKFFKWANHDDIHAPEFLEKCLNALEQNSSAVLAFPKSILIDEHGEHTDRLFYRLNINSSSPYERLKRYHECTWYKEINGGKPKRTGVWMPIYGVIKADALRKTKLIGNYISSDTILLEELALLGQFCLVSEDLFFKREHSQRSVRANMSFEKRILWFDPLKKDKLIFPNWKLLYEQFNIITKTCAPTSYLEKLLCYIEIRRYFCIKWRTLALELLINIVKLLSYFIPASMKLEERLPKVWW